MVRLRPTLGVTLQPAFHSLHGSRIRDFPCEEVRNSSIYSCWYDQESRPLGQTVEDVRQEQHPVLATGKLALELRLPGDPQFKPRYKSNSLSQIRGQPLGAPSKPGRQGMNDLL